MKSTANLDQVYSGVLRHLEEAFFIIEKTELGSYQFTDANEHACELLGYGRQELLSINPARIIDLKCWKAQLNNVGKHTGICTLVTKEGLCQFETVSTVFWENDTLYSFFVIKKKRTEDHDLRYRKNLINTVADSMQTFFLILEPDGRINKWNTFCEQETGYKLEDVKGEFVWDALMDEQERTSYKETLFQVSEIPLTHDNHWITKSGEKRFIQWSSAKMANEQGELEYIISVGIDITYRANFEKSLLESENRYRTLVSSMDDLVVTIGKNGEITSIYGKWFEADRTLEKKYLGKTMEEIFPGEANIHLRAFERAQNGEKVIYEWELRKGPGRYYQTILSPMEKESGTEVVSVTRDISQLKKSELREKRIYDSVATGIVSQGRDGQILFANESACEILGYRIEDLLNMSSANIEWQGLDEDGNPLAGHQHPPMVSLSTGLPVKGFVMGIFNPVKNEIRWLLVSTRVLYQNDCPNSQIETVISTFLDITEKKQWDQRIQKAEKLAVVGQLAAALAHEIRNPLTAIDGFLKLMKPSLVGHREKMYLDILFDEVEKIDLVTSEFLALAKPQNERKSILHLRKSILDPVVLTLAPLANMNGISISCEYERGDIYVLGNKNKLKQMMINLLKNAIEAMPDYRKGRIYVSTKLQKDKVSIKIRDEGYGISPERLKYIGEPFYSLKEKGTGLGIMICNKIVKEHSGELRLNSEVGVGTTVEVLLPMNR